MECFRFLEPLAPSNQQQHGSQRLRTRPQSSISLLCLPPSRRALSSLTSLRVRFGEFHDGRGRAGRHPKNWLSGNPTVQPVVQGAGTNLDEDGASAVANAQTPQPGSVGPLDDLSAGPFIERVALWLHGYFHARTRGAHYTQRGHGNRQSPFLYGYQPRFDGGVRGSSATSTSVSAWTRSRPGVQGWSLSIVNYLVCIRSRVKNMTRSFEHRGAGIRDVTRSMAQLHLYRRPVWLWRRRPGGRPRFFECHVISTWCAYFLVLRWVPRGLERGVSDPTAQFVLSSGELGIGRPCCAAQADRDLSETPPRHGRWSTTEDESGGVWGVWAKHRGGCSLRDGARSMRSAGRRRSGHFPLARKSVPTLRMHTRRERTVHTRTTAHAARHVTYTVICTCVACGAVALCRHVNN